MLHKAAQVAANGRSNGKDTSFGCQRAAQLMSGRFRGALVVCSKGVPGSLWPRWRLQDALGHGVCGHGPCDIYGPEWGAVQAPSPPRARDISLETLDFSIEGCVRTMAPWQRDISF